MADEQQTSELKNTVTIADAGPCKKKVTIEIPEEKVKKAVDDRYVELQRDAILPGFRKGRAPRRLLEKRFSKETSEQIKLKLIADASDEAIKEQKVSPLRDPNIDFEKIALPESGTFKFDFDVEVAPEFELPALEGIEVKKTKVQVTDSQVEKEIADLQKWSGMWVPKEEGQINPGDKIVADVTIKTEGAEESEKLDNSEIFVRKNGHVGDVVVEKLDELVKSAKPGDTKSTSVELPKTYFEEKYRGKKVDLEIKIKEVKYLKPSELNEEFFKRYSADSLDELKEKIREELQMKNEQNQRQEISEQIYKYLLDKTSFDLPLDIAAEQSQNILQRRYLNLLRMGYKQEQINEQIENLKAASDQQAKDQLKIFFIMEKIAAKLGIEVSEEEINGYIAQMALQQGQRPERLRQTMERDGYLGELKLQAREDKCIAKLLETAKITEVEPVEEKVEKPKVKHAEEKKHPEKKAAEKKKTEKKEPAPAAKKEAKKAPAAAKKAAKEKPAPKKKTKK